MKIEYAGPRPMISQHGIDFKDGKEDKYVYLMISIQILQAIDKNYEEHKSYSYDTKTKRFTNEEIHKILNSYSITLEDDVKNEEESYTIHINEEIEQVKARTNLQTVEKDTWIKNLELMRKYRIQRSINKIYYMHSIHLIKEIIKKEEITEIDTPFYEKYWHVLQTIQGVLEEGKRSVHTELKIEKANENMIAKLLIRY